MYSLFAVLLLSACCLALNPSDFLPCSFQVTTYTHILSGGVEIATSEDALYRDHDNLWRWESDFSGLAGLFDPHVWEIVWRPDYSASYHHEMLTGKCLKNNGASKMYPYPYDWIASKTDGVTWSEDDCTYNGKPATVYTAEAKSTAHKFVLKSQLYVLKTGEFVFSNGTLESNMIDVEFYQDVNQWVSNTELAPKLFVLSSDKCPVLTLPAEPSKDFAKVCYKSPNTSSATGAAFAVKPSIVALIASFLAVLLICIAL